MAKTGVKKVLTEEEKRNAELYIKRSGYWITRLADYMGLSYKTMRRIIKEDKDFSKRIKRAEAEFVGSLVRDARPDFVLRTKYKKEFEDKNVIEHQGDVNMGVNDLAETLRRIYLNEDPGKNESKENESDTSSS